MNNSQVASNWLKNKSGKSSNGNLKTDGNFVWSYNMIIGRTLEDGTKQVLDVRGVHSYSVTTASHVSKICCGSYTQLIAPICKNGWRYFPDDNSSSDVRHNTQSWKTLKGANSALNKYQGSHKLFIKQVYGNYQLFYVQTIVDNKVV